MPAKSQLMTSDSNHRMPSSASPLGGATSQATPKGLDMLLISLLSHPRLSKSPRATQTLCRKSPEHMPAFPRLTPLLTMQRTSLAYSQSQNQTSLAQQYIIPTSTAKVL